VDIYKEMIKHLEEGRPFVLATIVRTAGSSPRRAGAGMLVFADGSISGTIGGGTFEKSVIDDCLSLFEGGGNHLMNKYSFCRDGHDATGMCCGGEAEVFMELHGKPERLIVFGGGHVGRDLVRVAGGLNFRISVVDDRQDILNQYVPPIETILTDPDYSHNFPSLDGSCYVAIITRSHNCDKSVLKKAINSDCAYIGMIGSRSKVAMVFAALKKEGIDGSLLDKVHAPVGLDIGAEGPYEIAVSIAAELIAVKRKTSKLEN
jgi:xanthine dehydrogenase accessory factor